MLGVLEVWFWQDGEISIYRLQDGQYVKVSASNLLTELNINHLEQCLLMDSQLDSFLAFQEKYK